jgi:hypothetical protein
MVQAAGWSSVQNGELLRAHTNRIEDIALLVPRLLEVLPEVRAEMGVGFAQVRAELIKWMFLFWLGTVAATFFTR